MRDGGTGGAISARAEAKVAPARPPSRSSRASRGRAPPAPVTCCHEGAGASRRTAFRKLKDIDARTSYSHRGGYYTLDQLAHFDECGLWSFAGVRFSRAGTLLATAESFVNHAEAGHFVDELDNLLGIDPSTVAAGRRQLVERDVEVDRVRRAGGGRTPTEKGTIPTPTRCRSWPTARSRSSATSSSPTSPRPTSC